MKDELMKIEVSSYSEFERIIKDLKESLTRMSDCFQNETSFMKKIDKTDIWSGETQDKTYAKYLELSKCYNPVLKSLAIYIKYLETTLNNYRNSGNVISKSVNKNAENLNVN